jgi:hypothetical protein
MTQEDKELLIKDLCPRLPYGVYVEHINTGMRGHLHDLKVYPLYDKTDDHIYDYICSTDFLGDGDYFDIEAFKPYLFPLSSMTEEQMFDFATVQAENCKGSYPTLSECSAIIDWGYKHHFDVNGLIEKGLAIDATGKNIY